MRGTCLGHFIAGYYADRLRALKPTDMPERTHWEGTCSNGKRVSERRHFYGLRFYDPNYDPESAALERADGTFTKPEDVGKSFKQLRTEGKIVDLDVIRAAYKQTSLHATQRHTQPHIDGACGFYSVRDIARAIGLELESINTRSRKVDIYILRDAAGL